MCDLINKAWGKWRYHCLPCIMLVSITITLLCSLKRLIADRSTSVVMMYACSCMKKSFWLKIRIYIYMGQFLTQFKIPCNYMNFILMHSDFGWIFLEFADGRQSNLCLALWHHSFITFRFWSVIYLFIYNITYPKKKIV
jgi:hypothetical protein